MMHDMLKYLKDIMSNVHHMKQALARATQKCVDSATPHANGCICKNRCTCLYIYIPLNIFISSC